MTCDPVVDARDDHGAPQARGLRGDLLAREPERAHDPVVEAARGIVMHGHATEREAHELAAGFGVAPLLHAEEAVELDVPAGLFERLANRGMLQRFVGVEMSGGLVEHDASADVLFDQQKASIARHDGCDRHMWTPYGFVSRKRRNQGILPGVGNSHVRKSTGVRFCGFRSRESCSNRAQSSRA